MPTILQLRRGDTTQNNAFVGAEGELSYDTITGELRTHDGTLVGGKLVANQSWVTTQIATAQVTNSTTYATAAQGIIADSALQNDVPSSVNNMIPVYSGVTGKLLKQSPASVDTNGHMTVNQLSIDSGAIGNSIIIATGSALDINMVLAPKGTGNFSLSIPDNLISGGNSRGASAVDLQIKRWSPVQVASGNNSVISGGLANTSSGAYTSILGGVYNVAGGNYSSVLGGNANNISVAGIYSVASGRHSIITHSGSFLFADNNVIDFPSIAANEAAFRVGGGFRIVTGGTGTIQLDYAAFPIADGLSGQVLSTDGAGVLSWANIITSGSFASVAQGLLADTAVQPADLALVATTGLYGSLTGTPTLGTAAATNIVDYATAAQGILAGTALQPSNIINDALFTTPSITDAPSQLSTKTYVDTSIAGLATVASTGLYSSLTGTPTLGTAAATNITSYATSAQGLLAGTASQPGHTHVSTDITGAIIFNGITYPALDGTAGQVISTDGLGNLTFSTPVTGNFATVAQGLLADTALQPSNIINDALFTTPSATNAPSQLSTKTYVDNKVVGLYDHKGGYDANLDTPNIDTAPIPTGTIFKGDAYTVTVAGTFFSELVDIGDVLIANQNDPLVLTHWTRVNKNITVASTTTTGTVTLATSGQNISNVVVQGNDARLSDSRNPLAHTHVSGDITGSIVFNGLTYPIADGGANDVLKTNGAGVLAFATLGSAAFTSSTTYATAAQGILAGTALQPSNIINDTLFTTPSTTNAPSQLSTKTYVDTSLAGLATVASTGSYNDLLNTPTLGTAAATNIVDYATAAQGVLAGTASQPGHTHVSTDMTGSIVFNGLTYPSLDGTSGQVISTDGVGNLGFSTIVPGVHDFGIDNVTLPFGLPTANNTDNAIAIGYGAIVDPLNGVEGLAIGKSLAYGGRSIAISIGDNVTGVNSKGASALGGIAIGTNTIAAGTLASVAIGFSSIATVAKSVAIGYNNSANANAASCIGGRNNFCSSPEGGIFGGSQNNSNTGLANVIIGGQSNNNSGGNSIILGGANHAITAGANYSTAAGRKCSITHAGCFLFSYDDGGITAFASAVANEAAFNVPGGFRIITGGTGAIQLDYTSFPLADGTAGQVLSTDALGTLSWITPAAGGGATSITKDYKPVEGDPPAVDFATLAVAGEISVLQFVDTTLNPQSMNFTSIVPPTYTGGTIDVAISVSGITASTGNASLLVEFERTAIKAKTAINAFSGLAATGALSATLRQDVIISVTLTNVQANAIAAGEMFRFRLKRNHALDSVGTGGIEVSAISVTFN